MTSRETAYHEAGHAIACLHFGVVPSEIVARGDSGHVNASVQRLDERQRLIVAAAGAHAVEMLLETADSMSREDCDLAADGWRGLAALMHVRTAQASVKRHLDDLIWQHREQIAFLADRLMHRARIDAADLGELVHKYRSPLSMFRRVTPKPQPALMRLRHAADKLPFEDWGRWVDAGGMFNGIPGSC